MEENKEEQIKELTKDIGIAFQLAGTARFGPVAEILADKWQRKIPEGSVVVSKQVWEEHIENWDKTTEAVEERVRKETVEKFINLLTNNGERQTLDIEDDKGDICDKAYVIPQSHLRQVAKQLGVEIEE